MKFTNKSHDAKTGFLLTLPAIILFLIFVITPAAYAFILSFTNRHLIFPEATKFVGISNYYELFSDYLFRGSFYNTLFFAIAIVIIQGGIALFLALLIDKKLRGTNFFRSAFFAPTITSLMVISVLWAFLLNPNAGMINAMITQLGISPQPFLISEKQAMWCIIGLSAWQGVGMQMMIFLAGLQDIPEDLYEVARVDGVSPFKQFTHITWPLLRNTTIFVVITTSIFAFKLFVQPYTLTQGGPNDSTRSIVMYIYEQGFIAHRAGLSSAAAVIFFIIVLTLSLLQKKIIKEEKFYG